jgi:hypothetical protein
MVMVMTTLEQKIASALADDSITSTALAELINEVEIAIVVADKAAEEEREKALDPLASPDAAKARAALADAEFCRDRLRTVLPRLQQRFSEARSEEEYARWVVDYEEVKTKRDALVEELREIYPAIEENLTDLLLRIETCDREAKRVNSAKPFDAKEANGDGRWLLETELVARGLDHFRIHDLQIMRDLKLPKFEAGAQLAWPPHRPIDWSSVAPVARHPGADWAVEREERARATRADQERVIEHYAAMARQREEREAAEAQKRGKGAAA